MLCCVRSALLPPFTTKETGILDKLLRIFVKKTEIENLAPKAEAEDLEFKLVFPVPPCIIFCYGTFLR